MSKFVLIVWDPGMRPGGAFASKVEARKVARAAVKRGALRVDVVRDSKIVDTFEKARRHKGTKSGGAFGGYRGGKSPVRAKRGPSDEGGKLARMVAKWRPAGRRLSAYDGSLLEWHRAQLKSVLADKGVPYTSRLDDILVEASTRASHKSDHERYARAYGRG